MEVVEMFPCWLRAVFSGIVSSVGGPLPAKPTEDGTSTAAKEVGFQTSTVDAGRGATRRGVRRWSVARLASRAIRRVAMHRPSPPTDTVERAFEAARSG